MLIWHWQVDYSRDGLQVGKKSLVGIDGIIGMVPGIVVNVLYLMYPHLSGVGLLSARLLSIRYTISFFLYVLTSVEDIRWGLVYKCKMGVRGWG